MDLISRISENFSESAHLKLQSMDALAGPIAAAAEHMVQCLKHDGKILGLRQRRLGRGRPAFFRGTAESLRDGTAGTCRGRAYH